MITTYRYKTLIVFKCLNVLSSLPLANKNLLLVIKPFKAFYLFENMSPSIQLHDKPAKFHFIFL